MSDQYQEAHTAAEILFGSEQRVATRSVDGWNTVIDGIAGALLMVQPGTDAHAELWWAHDTAQALREMQMRKEIPWNLMH